MTEELLTNRLGPSLASLAAELGHADAWVYRRSGSHLTLVAAAGPPPPEGEQLSLAEGPYGFALRQGEVYLPEGEAVEEGDLCYLGARSQLLVAIGQWGLLRLERAELGAFPPAGRALARRWAREWALHLSAGAAGQPTAPGPAVRCKRVYDPAEPGDGLRVLVDRLWPRGVRRDRAPWDLWLPQVAPSPELRRWFGHDPARFGEFAQRYREELAGAEAALADLHKHAAQGPLTLLTAARDREHNHARVLGDCLLERFRQGQARVRPDQPDSTDPTGRGVG